MKPIIFLLTLFLFGAKTKELDEANGFFSYKFGTPAENYTNLTLEIDEGSIKLYSVNILPELNGTQLAYLRLTFCKNQLSAISLATKNSGGSKLMQYLSANFGPAKAVKENSEWSGKKVHLIFEPAKPGKEAYVSYYSNDVCAKK